VKTLLRKNISIFSSEYRPVRARILLVLISVLVGTCFGIFLSSSSIRPAVAREVEGPYRSEEEIRTIGVYRKVKESVVFITTISLAIDPFDIFLDVRPRQGTGSGVIVDPRRGIILTNLHVVGEAQRIEVTLANGKNYPAEIVGYDRSGDIAVLRLINIPKDLVGVALGDSNSLVVGQRVLAIGNPFGLHHTLTTGIVSSLERSVRSPTGALLRGLIQTDAAINPGNSGGPLLDITGTLIGINTAILSQSGDSAGIGFAIPINEIKRILPELIQFGKVRVADLGWVLVDTNQGPMVLRVLEGGPADTNGISAIERRVGGAFMRGVVHDFKNADLVVAVNGVIVRTKEEIEEQVLKTPRGESISLTLKRGGQRGSTREVRVMPKFE
jgi:S1-C subfamily serine protease